jgi:hypothetical protein
MKPYLENTNTKRAGGVAQGVGPEFKPWYCKNKQKNLSLAIQRTNKILISCISKQKLLMHT